MDQYGQWDFFNSPAVSIILLSILIVIFSYFEWGNARYK